MTLYWTARASENLSGILSYIAKDSEQSAATVAAHILECVEMLTTHPHIGRHGRRRGTRELVITGTQYIIPYRERGNVIELLAVVHGRERWPRKL